VIYLAMERVKARFTGADAPRDAEAPEFTREAAE
jgi:hypothetical protein